MDEPELSELKVAIIGCGRMGRERARCVRALNARLEFVFDVDAARSLKLANEYGAIAAPDPDQCFRSGVDAVFVCIAPGNRGEIERACLDHRTPFLVEKPVGVSATQCINLVERLSCSPIVNAVGYMNRYRRSVRMTREILCTTNVIGAAAHWLCGRYRVPWWENERLSGGPHNDQATHLFDLSRFLLGEVAQVEAIVASPSRVCCALRFQSGALATTMYSCEVREKDIGFQIFTEQGSISLSGWDFRVVENTITGVVPEHVSEDIFLIETRAFLSDAASGNCRFVQSDIADAFHTQQLMDAVRQSAARSIGTEARDAVQWSVHDTSIPVHRTDVREGKTQ